MHHNITEMQTTYGHSIQYADVAHLTLVSRLFHGTQVCNDIPYNTTV